jgi:orotidine-5'-phosphate decarboxylase
MPEPPPSSRASGARGLPAAMAERLIVALDVPTVAQAADLVARLDGTVSFFKVGLWLAFAEGIDGLLKGLLGAGRKVFLDAKMFDIGKTVEEGVARAADRGVSLVTVHGDRQIVEAAVRGKRGREIKVFAITALTSLSDESLAEMGYRLGAEELVRLRVREAARCGCDGVIASARDDPDALRRVAGTDRLLIATPGIRPAGNAADDHQRMATPREAILMGADYLVVGRPVVATPDPAASARRIIAEMEESERLRHGG